MTLILNLTFLLASWISIFFLERRNIFRSWTKPVGKRGKEFLKGFLLMAVLCVITQTTLSLAGGISWSVSSEVTAGKILSSIYYDINSVLFEELAFRGVLLYLLIKHLNKKSGVLISAIAFGVYHWFTQGVLGNPMAMLLVFIVTALMGYVFAAAFTKTRSIVLPLGLHLGWNLTNHNLFSNGPNGIMLMKPDQAVEVAGSYALLSLGLYLLVPVLVLLIIRSKFIKETQIAQPVAVARTH